MADWSDLPRNANPGGLAAYVTGSGPDLVLIHGVGLRSEAWSAALPRLSAAFRVWAVDMPGHGQSPVLDCTSVHDFSAVFEQVLGDIGAQVCVAGHSMGAMIAIDLARRNTEKITAIAALNAIYRRSPAAAAAVQARADALSSKVNTDPAPTLERWFGANPAGNLAVAADACRRWLTGCNREGYARAYRAFAAHDGPTDVALAGLSCPALFLTGADEPNSTPAMSRTMAMLAPAGHAEIIEHAAHMVPMTHGVEIARHLMAFFGSETGDS